MPSGPRLGLSCQLAGREEEPDPTPSGHTTLPLLPLANQVDSGDPYVEGRGSCPPLAPPAGGPITVAAGGPWWPGLQPASASHSCHAQQSDSEAAPPARGTFQDSLESLGALCSLFLAKACIQTQTYPAARLPLTPLNSQQSSWGEGTGCCSAPQHRFLSLDVFHSSARDSFSQFSV